MGFYPELTEFLEMSGSFRENSEKLGNGALSANISSVAVLRCCSSAVHILI